jgi:hypothetical protein
MQIASAVRRYIHAALSEVGRILHAPAAAAATGRPELEPAVNGRPGTGPGRPQGDDNHVSEILQYLVVNTVRHTGRSPAELSKRERLDVIDFLERKGAFQVRGAIRLVAQELGVSEPTVYRYIDEVRRRAARDGSAVPPSGPPWRMSRTSPAPSQGS